MNLGGAQQTKVLPQPVTAICAEKFHLEFVCLRETAGTVLFHNRRHAGQPAVVELAVYLGDRRLPCRVFAYRLTEEVVEQRRRAAHETARKKGRTPTHAYLNWLQFGWYLTNVPPEVWTAGIVATRGLSDSIGSSFVRKSPSVRGLALRVG